MDLELFDLEFFLRRLDEFTATDFANEKSKVRAKTARRRRLFTLYWFDWLSGIARQARLGKSEANYLQGAELARLIEQIHTLINCLQTGYHVAREALEVAAAALESLQEFLAGDAKALNKALNELEARRKVLELAHGFLYGRPRRLRSRKPSLLDEYDKLTALSQAEATSEVERELTDVAQRILSRVFVWSEKKVTPLRVWLYLVHGQFIKRDHASQEVRRLRHEVFPKCLRGAYSAPLPDGV